VSSTALSSECLEALQPPLSEEAVCLVSRFLVFTSSWCTEVSQHGFVVLTLSPFLPILVIIVPEDKFTKTRVMFTLWLALVSRSQSICTDIKRDVEIKSVAVSLSHTQTHKTNFISLKHFWQVFVFLHGKTFVLLHKSESNLLGTQSKRLQILLKIIHCKIQFKGSLPVDRHALAVHQGLGSAPAKSNELRVTKHWIQVLQHPRFSLRIWKTRGGETVYLHALITTVSHVKIVWKVTQGVSQCRGRLLGFPSHLLQKRGKNPS